MLLMVLGRKDRFSNMLPADTVQLKITVPTKKKWRIIFVELKSLGAGNRANT